jgi:hypothetical protein
LYSSKTKHILRQLLACSSAAPNSSEADQEDMVFFTRAISQALCVSTGAEAMKLLLRSSRASDDLSFSELMTHESDGSSSFEMHIVIRAWCPEIQPEWEFRSMSERERTTSSSAVHLSLSLSLTNNTTYNLHRLCDQRQADCHNAILS